MRPNLSPFGQLGKTRRKETLEGERLHFSACVSNLSFPYKNQETPVVGRVPFLVEKRSLERDWTVAPVHAGFVMISILFFTSFCLVFFCKFCSFHFATQSSFPV
jgi:hypothetical protein